MSRRQFITTIFQVATALSVSVSAQDDVGEKKPEDLDLAAIQGLWERDLEDKQGNVAGRATKLIEGRTETITYYDRDGKLLQAHRVEITLTREGGVRHFKHSEIEIIAGPRKGLKSDRRGGYVYKVRGDRFYEIQGVLVQEDQDPLGVLVWQRKKTEE
jgi:hypothetical protein